MRNSPLGKISLYKKKLKPEKNSFRFGPLTIVVHKCVHALIQCSIQCLVLILEFGSGNRLQQRKIRVHFVPQRIINKRLSSPNVSLSKTDNSLFRDCFTLLSLIVYIRFNLLTANQTAAVLSQ